jgi:hypothetical protein
MTPRRWDRFLPLQLRDKYAIDAIDAFKSFDLLGSSRPLRGLAWLQIGN